MAEKPIYDLIVIGAGIYGIQAARTYLEIHPDHKVMIFDASESVGGVWSRERVYDDFWTQTPLGIAEFSDMPLDGVPDDDTYYCFFRAKYMSTYLESYIATHVYTGKTLASRIQLTSRIERLIKADNGWTVEVHSTNGVEKQLSRYYANKVIDATGLTSVPNMPPLPHEDTFPGFILHHRDFHKIEQQLKKSEQWQEVIVIGGAKSAADMVYACAKMGKKVSWIIRRSGAGPAAFVSAKGSGMYANSNESFYTRFTSHFLASIFLDESKSMLGRFMYHTKLGNWLLATVWRKINKKAHAIANYDREDGKSNYFYNLRPDTSIFWQNDSTGICQRPDFFDLVARNVRVYREDIKSVTPTGLTLANGQDVTGSLILCGTGWKTSHPGILSSEGMHIEHDLGLADPLQATSSTVSDEQKSSKSATTTKILKRFPILNDPPIKLQGPEQSLSPLRLYKGILPINDHTIAFVGQLLLGNNFRVAEVQALFAVAALDGQLELPSPDDIRGEIDEFIAWSRCRYLKKGQQGTWLYWDMVPYTDHLLEFMGLQSHRHQGYFKDLFSTCFAKDLRGLIDEYKQKIKPTS